MKQNDVDILNCQEINIDGESSNNCPFISSKYNILQNNAVNKFGTAVIIKSDYNVENVKTDTMGRAIFYEINKMTFGNIYLQSGTDGISRGLRENFISETLPQLLVNCRDSGEIGGDLNCITKVEDCTNNPESKMSPSLRRFINVFSLKDSFRYLHPVKKAFSRYYERFGQQGASRIDRSYHWGLLVPMMAWYESVAFSDHLAYIVKLCIPDPFNSIVSPKSRPFFKTKPEVIRDEVFKMQLKAAMQGWLEVKQRGMPTLPWWEIVVKPGIKKLALSRSKDINKQKRRALNLLMLRQVYYSKKVQEGELGMLGQLRSVQREINDWYENESQKILVQSRLDDIQESEKVRIYHHEQDQKRIKRSAILKLKPGNELLEGHSKCAEYLENQVAELLSSPAILDPRAQDALLSEVTPVFTPADNSLLKKLPSLSDLKETLDRSNLDAAPGTDGLTSLLYKEHWDILGNSLHQVILEISKGQQPTLSQRTSLMVFGCKPKKMNSLLPSDKRRISLLNSDFKLASGVEATKFAKTLTHTLSPSQLIGGDDRRIHHGINMARDCIQAVSKTKQGCALLDLDFEAAFDYTVFSWVFMVLRRKGLAEEVIKRIQNLYINRITIPVINNVLGAPIANIRETLAQGCPSSMNWFAIAIDPLLTYLERRLQGIPIYHLPVQGPVHQEQQPLPPLQESYKVIGFADDVKPSVSTMGEFELVDRAAQLFERSSGNRLHRDPNKGKCKVLLMGRWKGTVEQTDIGHPHLRITDSLAFVGVQLQASWIKSRKENNDILVERLRSTINSWKSGKFMPLVSRPFSVNTFALSKVWFRTHIVDLRAQDINSISSVCKGYIYQDMLEKPAEVVLFRNAEQGGLGMHHIKCKAMASLITTFIQTAISNKFRRSLYHNSLFRYYCQDDRSIPKPDQPPYYSDVFFELIKKVLTDTPMNPAQMTLKQWYYHLLEELVTHEVRDGQRVQIQCRVEMLNPSNDWSKSFHLSRLKGLSSQIRSFLFKLFTKYCLSGTD